MKDFEPNDSKVPKRQRKTGLSKKNLKRLSKKIAAEWTARLLKDDLIMPQYIKFMLGGLARDDLWPEDEQCVFLGEVSKLVTRVKEGEEAKTAKDPKANDARSITRRISHILNEEGLFPELAGSNFPIFRARFADMTKDQNGRKIWQNFLQKWPQFMTVLERAFLLTVADQFRFKKMFDDYVSKVTHSLSVAAEKLGDLETLGRMSRDEVREFFRKNERDFTFKLHSPSWGLLYTFQIFIETAGLLGLGSSKQALLELVNEVSTMSGVEGEAAERPGLRQVVMSLTLLLDKTSEKMVELEAQLQPDRQKAEESVKTAVTRPKLQLTNLDLNDPNFNLLNGLASNTNCSARQTIQSLIGSNSLGFRLTPIMNTVASDRFHKIHKMDKKD